MMLSDFCIERSSTSNISARFSFGFKFKETIYDIFKELSNIGFGPIYKDKKTNCYHSKSHTYKEIGDLEKIWYNNDRVKIVPRNLELTPNVVRWWFIGDGIGSRYNPQLCTESFTKEENNLLIEKLTNLNIKCFLTNRNRIKIRSNSCSYFYEYIGKLPTQYEYKNKLIRKN